MIKVLRFTSPTCGPCKAMASAYEKMREKYGHDILFEDIDVSKTLDKARAMNVAAVPTLCLLDANLEVDRTTGYLTYDQLEEFIGGYVQKENSC